MATVAPQDLFDAITEIREDEVPGIVEALLASGVAPGAVIDVCREAMSFIGERFERGEAFIPELIMAGEMMKGVAAQVAPLLSEAGGGEKVGIVVIGTVKGDIHDIGKDLVASILDAAGFAVVNLGVDVPAESFVAAAQENPGCTIALSCLLTTGFDSMKVTTDALSAAGLRDQVKVMVGGAPVTLQVCEYAAADGWGADAATALELAKGWAAGSAA